MTTIDTSSEAPADTDVGDSSGSLFAAVAAWATTSDHKRIGRLFLGGSLAGLLLTAVMGVLLGIERADSSSAVYAADRLPELFQSLRFGLVMATLLPLGIGLAVAVVPLQLGARALAFPRAALSGFYAWLAGIVLVGVAIVSDGAIGGTDLDMVRLLLIGQALAALGLMAAAGAVATSVLTTRAPGMTMRRVPFFSWSALVTAIGILLAMPVLIGTIIYLAVDLQYATETFGGSAGVASWIGWAFTQPTTLVFAIPALGVFAELMPVAFRTRQRARGIVFAGLALVGVAALAGVTQQGIINLPWAGSGLNFDDFGTKFGDLLPFAIFNLVPLLGILMVLLTGAVLAKPTEGVERARRLTPSLMLSLFGLLMILAGSVGTVLYSIEDLGLQGTVFEEGALVFIGYGVALAVMGAIAWWAPKLWGRQLPNTYLFPVVGIGTIATLLAALPYYIAGFADQPAGAGVFSYSGPDALWNILVLIGHILMALTVVWFVAALISAFTGDRPNAAGDPWQAHTIEWATGSPAPGNNFVDVPVITSAEPMLDLRDSTTSSDDDGSQS